MKNVNKIFKGIKNCINKNECGVLYNTPNTEPHKVLNIKIYNNDGYTTFEIVNKAFIYLQLVINDYFKRCELENKSINYILVSDECYAFSYFILFPYAIENVNNWNQILRELSNEINNGAKNIKDYNIQSKFLNNKLPWSREEDYFITNVVLNNFIQLKKTPKATDLAKKIILKKPHSFNSIRRKILNINYLINTKINKKPYSKSTKNYSNTNEEEFYIICRNLGINL